MIDPRHSLRPRAAQTRGMAMVAAMLLLFGLLTVTLLGFAAVGTTTSQARSGGALTVGDNAVQMSNKRAQSTVAFNLAESGVEYTLQWMHSLAAPPSGVTAFTPGYVWASSAAGALRQSVAPDTTHPGNTFQVVVYPDTTNNPTGTVTGTPDKAFLIESVGRCGGSTEIVQAYVKTTSLSKYLVLVNNWASNNFWVGGLSTFDGPVHDNNFKNPPDVDAKGNALPDGQLENVAWYDAAGSKAQGWKDASGNAVPHPLFTYTGNDAYENSGSGVNWYRDNNFGGTSAPTSNPDPTQDEWKYVAAGGQSSVSYNAQTVPFPTNSNDQQTAAMGLPPGSAVLPPAQGVTVVPGGGITIGGDVDQMTLSPDPKDSTSQVIEVFQKDAVTGLEDYTQITIDGTGHTTQQTGTAPAGTLTSTDSSGHSTITMNKKKDWPPDVNTVNNGVVYVDGNVGVTDPDPNLNGTPATGGLSGTVADNAVDASGNVTHPAALTITTNASKSLNVDGDIKYNTSRGKNADGTYKTEASDSTFTKHAGTLGVVSNNILITQTRADGSTISDIETDGTFLAHGVFDVDHFNTRPPHNWENMGGYLSSTVGIFGQFSNSTGQIVHGMNNQFNYDARMRDTPPPFFPTTGNTYEVDSWHRCTQTLDGVISAS